MFVTVHIVAIDEPGWNKYIQVYWHIAVYSFGVYVAYKVTAVLYYTLRHKERLVFY